MASDTKIEWATKSWNPVRGCSRVSEGCRNCYAERQAMRFSGKGQPYEGLVNIANGHPQWTGKIRTVPEALYEPLRWRKPQRIFVNSMSDLFHDDVPLEFIDRVFAVMAEAQRHTFLILTKRPVRMMEYTHNGEQQVAGVPCLRKHASGLPWYWPLPNVWLGVSVEDQATADERIPFLMTSLAEIRWVSYEPALGPVDFRKWFLCDCGVDPKNDQFAPPWAHSATCPYRRRLHWIVAGGESGPGARPAHPDWFRRTRVDCHAAGVPFFFKQWGAFGPEGIGLTQGIIIAPDGKTKPYRESFDPASGERIMYSVGKKAAGRIFDGREWNEFPKTDHVAASN